MISGNNNFSLDTKNRNKNTIYECIFEKKNLTSHR